MGLNGSARNATDGFKYLVDQGCIGVAGPIGRLSTPEEQAWPLLALNSPRFSYVTGQSFLVDGGMFGAVQTGQLIE